MTSEPQAPAAGSETSELEPTEASETTEAKSQELVGRSPGQLMWLRFKRDRTGVISAYVVGFFLLIAICAPVISWAYGKSPYTQYNSGTGKPELFDDYGYPIQPNGGMSSEFWFGLEPGNGYDVFTKLIYGIRTSLSIAFGVSILVVITGVLLGVAAGYIGGRTDTLISRTIDLLLAFPGQLFFVAFMPIITALFVDPTDATPTYIRVTAMITVLWVLGWQRMARIVRGVALSLREREFVEAARVSGASNWRIIRKELLPNLVTPILVQGTYELPGIVTTAAGLSYLGVGFIEPTPDWGLMFAKAADVYQNDITYMFFPGLAMVVFVVAFNLLGDSVRDAFDPKTAR
ncbi:ABC transporter permease [Streptomyces sp. NPDC051940]|uniref:ABC transporter permease n=1 Tax=Streptomyces sp. NPDC051940 TaxID=3155675 RepID=UPI003444C01E